MSSTIGRLSVGFVAGALAVLIFHQGMFAALVQAGVITSPPPPRPPNTAWNMTPVAFWPDLLKAAGVAPVRVPRLLNQMFWGGLWGSLFGILLDGSARLPAWLKGALFGMLGPMLVGSWLLFPLLRGEPIFAGFATQRLIVGFLLNGVAFGVGLGLLYAGLSRAFGRSAVA